MGILKIGRTDRGTIVHVFVVVVHIINSSIATMQFVVTKVLKPYEDLENHTVKIEISGGEARCFPLSTLLHTRRSLNSLGIRLDLVEISKKAQNCHFLATFFA